MYANDTDLGSSPTFRGLHVHSLQTEPLCDYNEGLMNKQQNRRIWTNDTGPGINYNIGGPHFHGLRNDHELQNNTETCINVVKRCVNDWPSSEVKIPISEAASPQPQTWCTNDKTCNRNVYKWCRNERDTRPKSKWKFQGLHFHSPRVDSDLYFNRDMRYKRAGTKYKRIVLVSGINPNFFTAEGVHLYRIILTLLWLL